MLMLMPAKVTCIVKTVVCNGDPHPWAVAGQSVEVSVGGIDETVGGVGSVLCASDAVIPMVTRHGARYDPGFCRVRGSPIGDDTVRCATPAYSD
jgi:hypothetical protein